MTRADNSLLITSRDTTPGAAPTPPADTATARLAIDTWIDRGCHIIEPTGNLAGHAAGTLRETLAALDTPGPLRVAILMHAVPHIDTASVGVLLGLRKRASTSGGGVALIGCGDLVRAKLSSKGCLGLFGHHAGLESALAWLAVPGEVGGSGAAGPAAR